MWFLEVVFAVDNPFEGNLLVLFLGFFIGGPAGNCPDAVPWRPAVGNSEADELDKEDAGSGIRPEIQCRNYL